MFSRLDRNLIRKAASLLVLALLVVAATGVTDARSAVPRGLDFVDGGGMAATDNTEDPRQGGGGSLEGDPWGGEQRDAGTTVDGPVVDVVTPTTTEAARAVWSSFGFWSWLLAFLTSLAR